MHPIPCSERVRDADWFHGICLQMVTKNVSVLGMPRPSASDLVLDDMFENFSKSWKGDCQGDIGARVFIQKSPVQEARCFFHLCIQDNESHVQCYRPYRQLCFNKCKGLMPSLQLAASLHLKNDGWNTVLVSFWGPAYFQWPTVSFREGMCFFYEAAGDIHFTFQNFNIAPLGGAYWPCVAQPSTLWWGWCHASWGVSCCVFVGLLQYMFMGPRYDYVNKSICKL